MEVNGSAEDVARIIKSFVCWFSRLPPAQQEMNGWQVVMKKLKRNGAKINMHIDIKALDRYLPHLVTIHCKLRGNWADCVSLQATSVLSDTQGSTQRGAGPVSVPPVRGRATMLFEGSLGTCSVYSESPTPVISGSQRPSPPPWFTGKKDSLVL